MGKIEFPNEVKNIINNPKSIVAVSTINEDGTPHVVYKGSVRILEDGNIAFIEVIENSRTTKNILSLINIEEDKKTKLIAMNILDAEKMLSYEIRLKFNRFAIEGPLWKSFLKETWKILPDIDPVGVWIFEPVEINNQSLPAKIKEEGERLEPRGNFWFKYLGRDL